MSIDDDITQHLTKTLQDQAQPRYTAPPNPQAPPASIEDVLAERNKTHGEYCDHAYYTQALKDVCHSSPNWDKLTPSQKETIEMNCHKLGRILAGDPNEPDHWRDISGYATLVVEQLTGKRRSYYA